MKKIFVCVSVVLILVLAMFVGCGKKEAERETVGSLVLELDVESDSYSVVGTVQGISGDVVIPSTHNGKNVTKIAREAFERCSAIKSVKIPNTVKEIGPPT